jgi:hypothetical protein
MSYKETLSFVAKCLTLSLDDKHSIEIQDRIKSKEVDWDAVVTLSTSHFVFPALYCNLKRQDLLVYLPRGLSDYMKEITNLNRERNVQIIKQAQELNLLFKKNDIRPVFLKGTGNLLEGLYEDIAERMVGDIDFIVPKDAFYKSATILLNDGYKSIAKESYLSPNSKHFHRLVKEKKIAAVEIHKELLKEPYAAEFNFLRVRNDIQNINDIIVLSYENQLSLSIFANQINDDGYQYKSISLRNAYDVFLLSKKTNAQQIPSKFKILKNPLNCFLALCYNVFSEIPSLDYDRNKKTEKHIRTFNELLLNDKKRKFSRKLKYKKLFIKLRLLILYKSLFDKEYRVWLINRVSDKNWQREKMLQIGFKKEN